VESLGPDQDEIEISMDLNWICLYTCMIMYRSIILSVLYLYGYMMYMYI